MDGGPPLRRRRPRWALLVGGVVVAGLAVAATFVLAAGGDAHAGPCPGADGRSGELRRCLAPSLAFIETPLGAGSGVLLDEGYIVTNAHVIDPFSAVDVTFSGGGAHREVPVVGVDAAADIAVLGPVDVDAPALTLDPLPDVEEIGDVFLVGYPGGIEADDPSLTLSGGVLSRLRDDDTFGLIYLQTDAAIAGGQSGGALVDANGTVLGISGLGFAEEFALALSTDDVATAVARILDGAGDARRVLPTLDTADSRATTSELTSEHSFVSMILPADETRREDVELEVDAAEDVAVFVSSYLGEPLGVNEAAREVLEEEAELFDDPATTDVDVLDEVGPGRFRLDLPPDEVILVDIERVDRDTAVALSADVPFEVMDPTAHGQPVQLGEPVREVVDSFTFEVVHTVDLEAGDEVAITVRGGTSDAFFTVLGPDEDYDPLAPPAAEDGGGGLYDMDPSDTFKAEEDGEHRIVVGTWDGVVATYELLVEPAD